MFEKIKTCLCHPSKIGAYFKDSIPKNILLIFIFMLLFIFANAAKTCNSEHFNNLHSSAMTDSIALFDDNGIYFDSELDKLCRNENEKISIAGSQYRMNFFCEVASGIQSSEIVLNFKESYVDVLVFNTKIGTLNYSDYNFDGFSLLNIKNGNYKEKLAFQKMIDFALDEINQEYSFIVIGFDTIALIEDILFMLAVCVLLSLMVNQGIKLGVRIRLCMLDVLVYILCLIFMSLFSLGWIQYFGMFLACFYTISTFRHIVRVEKRRF